MLTGNAQIKGDSGSVVIDGMEQYRAQLLKLVAEGETLLEAQREAQSTISNYYRCLTETQVRGQRVAAVKAAAKQIQDQPQLIEQLIADIQHSLAPLKRSVTLFYHLYVLSLIYESASKTSPPVSIATDTEPRDYKLLLSSLMAFQTQVKTQATFRADIPKKIEASTDITRQASGESIFVKGSTALFLSSIVEKPKDTLAKIPEIAFEIPLNLKSVGNYYNLRIKWIRCVRNIQEFVTFLTV